MQSICHQCWLSIFKCVLLDQINKNNHNSPTKMVFLALWKRHLLHDFQQCSGYSIRWQWCNETTVRCSKTHRRRRIPAVSLSAFWPSWPDSYTWLQEAFSDLQRYTQSSVPALPMSRMLNAIVAVCPDLGIGKDGQLPWHPVRLK